METIESDIEKQKNPEPYRMASTFGLIMGLATSAVHFVFYLLEGKVYSPLAVMALNLIAVILVIRWATLNYRNALGGYISYWKTFVFGVKIFVFAGIIGAVYSFIFSNIDPDYAYRQLELVKQQFLDAGLTDMAIDKLILSLKEGIDFEMQHPFQSALSAIFLNTVLGALFCSVSSAILRKDKPVINES
ncbi:MAG: DUF4199 domain-containing protein [Prevotellaceae bacterium]|jgi:hypothetical protein|nr:DUF4199 domain-containing protein [Prevotellaceae bacterium]